MSSYGPSLPPGMSTNVDDNHVTEQPLDNEDTQTVDSIGPALPPHLQKQKCEESVGPGSSDNEVKTEDDDKVIGPPMPSKVSDTQSSAADIYGPSLPIRRSDDDRLCPDDYEEDDEEDSDVIGPLPPSSADAHSASYSVVDAIDARSIAMKKKLLQKDQPQDSKQQRESWMLSLPTKRLPSEMKGAGVQGRKFRKSNPLESAADDDTSVWTDTPEDKARKAMQGYTAPQTTQRDITSHMLSLRDQKMAQEAEKLKSKRGSESLLDHHAKKQQKLQGSSGTSERRPFDRDVDLQISSVSPTKRADMINKSKSFNSRFSSGNQRYL